MVGDGLITLPPILSLGIIQSNPLIILLKGSPVLTASHLDPHTSEQRHAQHPSAQTCVLTFMNVNTFKEGRHSGQWDLYLFPLSGL